MVRVWCHLGRNHWLDPNIESNCTMERHHTPTLQDMSMVYFNKPLSHSITFAVLLGELKYQNLK